MKLSPPVEDGLVTSCNCKFDPSSILVEFYELKKSPGSICSTNGYLMVYPLESNITWLSGFDSMTTYNFAKEMIAHSFCSAGKSTDPNFFSENWAVKVSLDCTTIYALRPLVLKGREMFQPTRPGV